MTMAKKRTFLDICKKSACLYDRYEFGDFYSVIPISYTEFEMSMTEFFGISALPNFLQTTTSYIYTNCWLEIFQEKTRNPFPFSVVFNYDIEVIKKNVDTNATSVDFTVPVLKEMRNFLYSSRNKSFVCLPFVVFTDNYKKKIIIHTITIMLDIKKKVAILSECNLRIFNKLFNKKVCSYFRKLGYRTISSMIEIKTRLTNISRGSYQHLLVSYFIRIMVEVFKCRPTIAKKMLVNDTDLLDGFIAYVISKFKN